MKLFKKKHILDSCTYYLKYKNYLDVYRNGIFYKRLDNVQNLYFKNSEYYTYSSCYFDFYGTKYFDENFNIVNYCYYDNICEKFQNDEYTLYIDDNIILKSKESLDLCENSVSVDDDNDLDIHTLIYNDEKYIIYNKHLIKGDYEHIVNIYPEYEIIEFKNILTYYKNFDNNIVDESEIKKLILK